MVGHIFKLKNTKVKDISFLISNPHIKECFILSSKPIGSLNTLILIYTLWMAVGSGNERIGSASCRMEGMKLN